MRANTPTSAFNKYIQKEIPHQCTQAQFDSPKNRDFASVLP